MGQVLCCSSDASEHLTIKPSDSIYVVCHKKSGKLIDILHVVLEGNGSGKLSGMGPCGKGDLTWDGKNLQRLGSGHIWSRQENGEFDGGDNHKIIDLFEYWQQVQDGCFADELGEALALRQSQLPATLRALDDISNPYTCILQGNPLYDALASGILRLVRGKFLEDLWEKRQPWPLRQELPKHALWDAEEACSLWRMYGPCFFFALSYGWLHPVRSDPDMWYLERLAHILQEYRKCSWAFFLWFRSKGLVDPLAQGPPEDIGYFIDFCSIPQQDHERGIVRSAEDHSLFIDGLGVMNFLYGHFATTVTRITAMPVSEQRKYHMRGWTNFEEVISSAKPEYEYRVFTFSDTFRPGANELRSLTLFLDCLQSQALPRSPEQFKAQLQRRRDAFPRNSKITLFQNPNDEGLVVNLYCKAWAHIRQSESLIYRRAGWGSAEAMNLASFIAEFQNLKKLVITGSNIGGDGMLALLRSIPVELLELTITDSGAEDAVATVSAEFQRLQQLRKLDLSFCKWGDAGIESLANHIPRSVRHLELVGTDPGGSFTDRGGVALAKLLHKLDLQKLIISKNPIGSQTVDALEGTLPGSTIQDLMVGHWTLSNADRQRLRRAWAQSLKPESGLTIW